jgi:hypothetical protein
MCAIAWKRSYSMSTSLEEREASCAYKGHNSPFDSTTVYSVGSTVTQKHFGQSSLILLHIKIYTFIRFLDSNLIKSFNLSQFYSLINETSSQVEVVIIAVKV